MTHTATRAEIVAAEVAAGARVPALRWSRAVLGAALACWLVGLVGVELRDMNGLGLLSVVRPEFFVAAVLLTIGFVWTGHREPTRERLLGAYLVSLVALLHATPAVLYGSVRYSWSWKHLGMVDYIQRTGEVDPDARFLAIYHGWPGLFSFTALVSDVTGVDAATIALWTPFALTLGAVLALDILLRALTDDRRVRWLALWLYVCANWVGQEYFSPQGVTFVLYLAALAIALPIERRSEGTSDPALGSGIGPRGTSVGERRAARVLVVAIVVAIAASHQLTPIMVVVTFGVAAVLRASRTAWIAVTGAAAMLVWLAGPAWTYFSDNTLGVVDTLGSPAESSAASLADTQRIDAGQVAVVIADRFLTQAIVVLAIVGLFSRRLSRSRTRLVAFAMCAPAALLVTDYGGEIVFRAYLFATPWLALAAATALAGRRDGPPTRIILVARIAALLVLLASFMFAYFGKERGNYFTDEEIAVATRLYDRAPADSLLVEGSRSYPGSSLEYEKFSYVPIDREPDATKARIAADPEGELYRWLSDERYAATYLIITRSMKAAEASVPTMPTGLLDDIDRELSSSSRFEVVDRSEDAVVFTIAGRETTDATASEDEVAP